MSHKGSDGNYGGSILKKRSFLPRERYGFRYMWTPGYKLYFASTLLFVIGSAFYVWLAVNGYLWVRNLQAVPLNILTADDDVTWYTLTEHVTYDDDYLTQVGNTPYWISMYQVIYFSASFCFALAGLLDIISERSAWNLFRFFGGIFGMVSAITYAVNVLASSIISAISVHLYLADAIVLLWRQHKSTDSIQISRLMTIVLIIGALSYFLGTVIDLVISYLWIFDPTINYNLSTSTASLAAALGWLLCSICYTVYFYYIFRSENKMKGLEDKNDSVTTAP